MRHNMKLSAKLITALLVASLLPFVGIDQIYENHSGRVFNEFQNRQIHQLQQTEIRKSVQYLRVPGTQLPEKQTRLVTGGSNAAGQG